MTWTRTILLSVLLAGGVSACQPTSTDDPLLPAYQLYAVILGHVQSSWGAEAELVIDPRTYSSSEGRFPMFVPWEGSTDFDVDDRMAAAYNRVNEPPPDLLDETRLPPGVRYLTQAEQEELEQGSTIWRQDIVILRFARPGFAVSADEALLQYGVLCGPTCGEGTWARLVRSDDRWIIASEVAAWSS